MATAKRLPSGNWRVRVYDSVTKSYKSFTAPTKKEAERDANDWLNGRKRTQTEGITVYECVEAYIESKENLLSP